MSILKTTRYELEFHAGNKWFASGEEVPPYVDKAKALLFELRKNVFPEYRLVRVTESREVIG